MLCAPLDWQYAELPSSASDAVLCSVLVRKMGTSKQIEKKSKEKKANNTWFKKRKLDTTLLKYMKRKFDTYSASVLRECVISLFPVNIFSKDVKLFLFLVH